MTEPLGLTGEDETDYERLAQVLRRAERLVVAFSGGADSALLAYAATNELGAERVLCATAVSASLAGNDLHETEELAKAWGLRHVALRTNELDNPEYVRNGLDRCYFCKAELMQVLAPVALGEGARIALGVNLDDLGDHRPGQQAAREEGGVFPLVEAALTKQRVRELSRSLGLRTWDKPANACLSSRIPQGTPVTIGRLRQIEDAEAALRRLGFAELRARHYDDTCRIELPLERLAEAIDRRDELVAAVHAAGYRYVTLDLEGLRSGNVVRAALEDTERAS